MILLCFALADLRITLQRTINAGHRVREDQILLHPVCQLLSTPQRRSIPLSE